MVAVLSHAEHIEGNDEYTLLCDYDFYPLSEAQG